MTNAPVHDNRGAADQANRTPAVHECRRDLCEERRLLARLSVPVTADEWWSVIDAGFVPGLR
jgi:hypothetical protein